jgi:hypothetical protein
VHGIASVEIAADASRWRSWVGEESLPVRIVDGAGEVRSLTLETADGRLVVG